MIIPSFLLSSFSHFSFPFLFFLFPLFSHPFVSLFLFFSFFFLPSIVLFFCKSIHFYILEHSVLPNNFHLFIYFDFFHAPPPSFSFVYHDFIHSFSFLFVAFFCTFYPLRCHYSVHNFLGGFLSCPFLPSFFLSWIPVVVVFIFVFFLFLAVLSLLVSFLSFFLIAFNFLYHFHFFTVFFFLFFYFFCSSFYLIILLSFAISGGHGSRSFSVFHDVFSPFFPLLSCF